MPPHVWYFIGAEKGRGDSLTVREACQRCQIVRETRYNRSKETKTIFFNEKGTKLSRAECVPSSPTD